MNLTICEYIVIIQVNNAGVSYNELDENSVEHAESVIKTNFYGSKSLIEALLPLFRFSSSSITRVLNVSSRLGSLNVILPLFLLFITLFY